MRKEYINSVKKHLNCSPREKKEIIRDLNEIFESANEHGESDQDVIDRLGAPSEYANHCMYDFEPYKHIKKGKFILCSILGFASVLCLSMALYIHFDRIPDHAIGYGKAITEIAVNNAMPFDLFYIFAVAGIILAVFLLFIIFKSKKR